MRKETTPTIFMSYRRIDVGGHARALHEYLVTRFGAERIFFDRFSIEGGEQFDTKIRSAVHDCVVLLALMGPDWLEVRNAAGRHVAWR